LALFHLYTLLLVGEYDMAIAIRVALIGIVACWYAPKSLGDDRADAEIKTERVEEQPTMTIRFRAMRNDLGAKFGQSFGALYGYIVSNGGKVVGPPFGRYHDTTGDEFDVEVGVPVAAALHGTDNIKADKLPASEVATLKYVGPYDGLQEAHRALREWVETNGKKPAGPAWESYVSRKASPSDTTENVTKLYLPISSDE
jgi:effector-binding domain-containing protein